MRSEKTGATGNDGNELGFFFGHARQLCNGEDATLPEQN
jgi:hypothetical protein